ncbi:MAG: phosphocholine cytidylyltransferase family protein [Chloroflexi bacterium]|nr:phosphocholine cytidylyltransferase family protein [Chloroflexota bacterium]
MKGLILAAGMGTRLDPLTRTCPKCMVHVAGRPMMEYQLEALRRAGVDNCTVVVGYLADSVREYFGAKFRGLSLTYVENTVYAETNNLYSFCLAKAELDDDVLLVEGDLVFDEQLISRLVSMDEENVAIVDSFQPHMDGTVILANGRFAKSMVLKVDQGIGFDYGPVLKTVNIYRLSRETLAETIVPEMEDFLAKGRTDQYYEAAFAKLIDSGRMKMAVMYTGKNRWAEIDTLEDLRDAGKMFASTSAAIG